MQPKYQRLRKNWEFQAIINQRRQIFSKHLVFYFQPSVELSIGISVPKKNSNAVARNYYKRQIKSILQTINLNNLNYKIVIIIRKSFLDLSFVDKTKELIKLFERMRSEEKPKA
ncbi:ribonuclease P protein component [Candidatus Mycoplasma pogonae]